MRPAKPAAGPARIVSLRIENYRALRRVELTDITPLTVVLGPNGSGKSTVFDVFNFLSECFTVGLRKAWDKRGRFRELRSRGSEGPLVFELRYRESQEAAPATYHIEIDERGGAPVVAKECWYVSHLSIDDARGQPEAGTQERLTKSGGNLANVIQYLMEKHPTRLELIFETLRRRVPRLERVEAETMPDNRLLLRIKDAPFSEPILARFASDGTLKMLAYLVVLKDPTLPQFIGIEEPENFLHPRLLPELAEECRAATECSQLLVTTHSPFFLNTLRADEVRVLYRDEHGFTQTNASPTSRGCRVCRARRAARARLARGPLRRRRSAGA